MDINLEIYSKAVWTVNGRTFPHIDCYGFVLDVRKRLGLGVWPEYEERPYEELDKGVRGHIPSDQFSEEPRHGSLILCYVGPLVRHIAIVLRVGDELMAAECQRGVNVRLLSLRQLKRRYTKLEYYYD